MLASSQAPQFLYLNAAISGLVIGDLLLERGEREREEKEILKWRERWGKSFKQPTNLVWPAQKQ